MNRINKKNIIFYLPILAVSLIYLLLLYITPIGNDDLALIDKYQNLTLRAEWDNIVFDYLHWSSRVLINGAIHVMLASPRILWCIITGALIFALFTALNWIFNEQKDEKISLFVLAVILCFPFWIFGTAGWIVTSVTYLWTSICAVIGVIPLVQLYKGKRSSPLQAIISCFCLIFAANLEQMIVILIILYAVSVIYFIYKKMNSVVLWIQTVLLVGSLIFIVTAPGNRERTGTEALARFKGFGLLNLVDKADIGFFATMHTLLCNYDILFLMLTLLLAVYICIYYKEVLYRMIAIIPFVITLLTTFLRDEFLILFPDAASIIQKIPMEGMINVGSYQNLSTYVKVFMYCMVAVCFVTSIYLVFRNTYKTIIAIALLLGGMGSRVLLGFSPTVWESGIRTYTFLYLVFLIIILMIIQTMYEEKKFSLKHVDKFLYLFLITGILTMLNLFCGIV